jgi:hypothetical protein
MKNPSANLGLSILTFAWYLDGEDNECTRLSLLDTDKDLHYVTDENSPFYGFRNARTWTEWVGLFIYVVLMHLASVSPKSMTSSDSTKSLAGRAAYGAELMVREGQGVTFPNFLQAILQKRPAPLAALFVGEKWLLEAFKAKKSQKAKLSLMRFYQQFDLIFVQCLKYALAHYRQISPTPSFSVNMLCVKQRPLRFKRFKAVQEEELEDLDAIFD